MTTNGRWNVWHDVEHTGRFSASYSHKLGKVKKSSDLVGDIAWQGREIFASALTKDGQISHEISLLDKEFHFMNTILGMTQTCLDSAMECSYPGKLLQVTSHRLFRLLE